MSTILVFDEDPKVAEFFDSQFPSSYQFIRCESWTNFVKVMEGINFDLILIHIDPDQSPKDDFLDPVRQLQSCQILLFSAAPKNDLMRLSKRLLADGFVQKILDPEITLKLIEPYLAQRKATLNPEKSEASEVRGKPHLEKTTRVNINQFLREQFTLNGPEAKDS